MTNRSETSTGIDDPFGYGFPLRESHESDDVLEAPFYFDGDDSTASFRIRIEFSQGTPSELGFRITEDYDNENYIDEVWLDYSATGVYSGVLNIPGKTVIDKDHVLDFHFNWNLSTGQNEWTLYVNEESYIELPIAGDIDDDGIPDYLDDDNTTDPNGNGNGNGNGDDDDDDDAFPGFEAPLVVAGIACIILLRRRR